MPAPADKLHRLAKRAMDNGTARTREEAEALLRGYRVAIAIGPREAADRHHQAALLTAVALGRRVFLGGVSVQGPVDTPLGLPCPLARLSATPSRRWEDRSTTATTAPRLS